MKKILLLITFLLSVTIGTYAAAPTGSHLEFMDIPICGSTTAFGNSLKTKGFTFDSDLSNYKIYNGSYYGYDADVYVRYNDTNQVYAVFVFIDTLTEEAAEDIVVDIALRLIDDFEGCMEMDDDSEENELDFWVNNTNGDLIGLINFEADENDGEPRAMISFFDYVK